MRKEGISKDDIGRDGFLERAWKWKETYGGRIIEQLKKLGSSCDWSRERFTLDDGCSKAVQDVFMHLYEKGLIYRGERIINWCPQCLTSISDAEVEFEEQNGHFWHLRYPFEDGSGYLELATTRPETLLGDTAVAVNPKDERYADKVGKYLILPLVGRRIPVVADDYVEQEFGTGVVKIATKPARPSLQTWKPVDSWFALKIMPTMSAPATVAEPRWNPAFPSSGSLPWKPLQNLPLRRFAAVILSSFPNALRKTISIGWKIFATGVFPVSFGGATVFPPITVTMPIAVRWLSAVKP